MLPGGNETGHNDEAIGVWNVSLFRNARENSGSFGELSWRAVILHHFEEKMRTTSKIHALTAVPYVRTELQLRFAWCMTGLTMGEYGSEKNKRSKEENLLLMTSLRDLMIN